jgi:hypothetical protein
MAREHLCVETAFNFCSTAFSLNGDFNAGYDMKEEIKLKQVSPQSNLF